MRFKGLDLNLIVVLDRLLTEQNVSRASDQLHLSQSATSAALARLREYFGDQLLTQIGRRMVPTPRGLELGPAVRAVLMQIDARVLNREAFDPAISNRSFRIMASDYVSLVALRHGLARISAMAPAMTFTITPGDETPARMLERGDVDLLIMPDRFVSELHPSIEYFRDRYVCVADPDFRQSGGDLTFDEFLSKPHAVVRFSQGRQLTFEDWFLERYGHARRIELITTSYASLPYLIAGSRRLATLHERHADLAAPMLGLAVMPCPVEIPPIREVIQWHSAMDGDDALEWVRSMLLMERTE
ncbi:MAG: LysR family transcriptional regulator [Mesorhizobium sp.]|nr:LysR family transcriptional regulator [Mesorhizobium sp.]